MGGCPRRLVTSLLTLSISLLKPLACIPVLRAEAPGCIYLFAVLHTWKGPASKEGIFRILWIPKPFTMNKMLTLLAAVLLLPFLLAAQMKDYQVVFDLTSKDTTAHQAVIRMINLITKETPDAQIEVVFYGQSLDMIRSDKSTVAGEVTRWGNSSNVSFVACEAAMKKHNISKGQLIPGVKTVPDGVYEIISRQKQGWGYIKVVP